MTGEVGVEAVVDAECSFIDGSGRRCPYLPSHNFAECGNYGTSDCPKKHPENFQIAKPKPCPECGKALRETLDAVTGAEVRGCLECRYAILTHPDGRVERIRLPGPLERMVIDLYEDSNEEKIL